jgi:hypothetical protein
MNAIATDQQPNNSASDPRWRGQEGRVEVRGASYRLRLVRFPTGWLASVDTVEGPTLGYDSSPYLAVSRAVEPIGGGLDDAMSIVATLRQPPPTSAGAPVDMPSVPRLLSESGRRR